MIVEQSRRQQFTRYLVAGIINTAVTYALLILLMHAIDYRMAYTLVYALGVALSYWLQSSYVFRLPLQWRAAMRFPMVYVVQYLLGLVLLWVFVDRLDLKREVSALLVVAANIPVGFVLARFLLMLRPGNSSPSH